MTDNSINTLVRYRPMVRLLYENSGSPCDIGTWVQCVGQHLTLVDSDDIFTPITLRIKVAGRLGSVQGMVSMQVDPTDDDWYQNIRSAVAHGMNIAPQDIAHTKLCNMRGADIAHMTCDDLHHVGQLTVEVRGKQRKTEKAFVPQAHVREDKINDLVDWYENDVREQVITHAANALVGSSPDMLDTRTRSSGKLITEIQAIIEESVPGADMNKFMRIYGVNERARTTPGPDAAARIARSILVQIRKGMEANEGRIDAYHSNQESRRAAERKAQRDESGTPSNEDDEDFMMDKPLFGSRHVNKVDIAPATTQDIENDRSLYTKIIRSALGRPTHASTVVYMVYRGRPTRQPATSTVGKKAPEAIGHRRHRHHDRRHDRERRGKHHHHHHHHHHKTQVILDDSSNGDGYAYYTDDTDNNGVVLVLSSADQKRVNAARKVHQFSGRHVFMKPVKRSTIRSSAPKGVYNPLNEPVPSSSQSSHISERVPDFVPYVSGRGPTDRAPKVVPIDHIISDRAPKVVPIGQSELVEGTYVPWRNTPSEKVIDTYVDRIEQQIASDEQMLGKKLWTDTDPKTRQSKMLSNGMPSIFAFADE